MRYGQYWLVAALAVGGLQAWDSGAFGVGGTIAALTVAGILIPAVTLVMRVHHGLRIAALVVGAGLLVWARMMSPESLNTLHFALFPAAIAILFVAAPAMEPRGFSPGDTREG